MDTNKCSILGQQTTMPTTLLNNMQIQTFPELEMPSATSHAPPLIESCPMKTITPTSENGQPSVSQKIEKPVQPLPGPRKCILTVQIRHQFLRPSFLGKVFGFGNITDLAIAAQVCRRWRRMSYSKDVAQQCILQGGLSPISRALFWMHMAQMLPVGVSVQGVLAAATHRLEKQEADLEVQSERSHENVLKRPSQQDSASPGNCNHLSTQALDSETERGSTSSIWGSLENGLKQVKGSFRGSSFAASTEQEQRSAFISEDNSLKGSLRERFDSSIESGREGLLAEQSPMSGASSAGPDTRPESPLMIHSSPSEGILHEESDPDSQVSNVDLSLDFSNVSLNGNCPLVSGTNPTLNISCENNMEEKYAASHSVPKASTSRFNWLSSKLEMPSPPKFISFGRIGRINSFTGFASNENSPNLDSAEKHSKELQLDLRQNMRTRKRKSEDNFDFSGRNYNTKDGIPDDAPIERMQGLFDALVESSEMFTPDQIAEDGDLFHRNSRRQHHNTIDMDIRRTPRLNEVGSNRLRAVLSGVCMFLPDIGYVQGMNYIGHFFLKHLLCKEEDAFWVFLSFFSRQDMKGLFTSGMPELHLRFFQLDRLVRWHAPELSEQFSSLHVTPNLYATSWFVTLLTDFTLMPPDQILLLWDILFIYHDNPTEQWSVIFRILLMLLTLAEERLLATHDFDQVLLLLHQFPFQEILCGRGVQWLLQLAKHRLEHTVIMSDQLWILRQEWEEHSS